MSSISSIILPQLPYLRRFARSLTGRQESGDAYVAAVLEALISDPSVFPKDQPPRIALYRVFLKTWDSVAINGVSDIPSSAGIAGAADRHLETIAPRPRQAFLLVAVEKMSLDIAALALDTTVEDTRALIDQAGNEIAEQVATSVLIIEDEPLIALDLSDLVTSIGHTVCATATTHKSAVAAFAKHKPGLVLADVQLADGSSGLDAVNEILKSFEVPVIFITAYPERLLTGRRPEPTFLINKPFQPEAVKAIISQALFFEEKATKSAA